MSQFYLKFDDGSLAGDAVSIPGENKWPATGTTDEETKNTLIKEASPKCAQPGGTTSLDLSDENIEGIERPRVRSGAGKLRRPRVLPMQYEDNPVSIKYYVKRFILEHRHEFENKVVIDAPAGSGVTSGILRDVGATVYAYDLFPEYFQVEGMACERANIMDGLPVPDGFADIAFCQEGLEHFSDQYRALQEFNRMLKKNGSLFVTTPNYSNLQSKLSYFLFETEYYLKMMPANEMTAIWVADESRTKGIYLGHFFLIGIQKLRVLAKLSGFKIKRIIFTRASTTSLILLPFVYPFLLLTNWWTYRYQVRKNAGIPSPPLETVFRESMHLNRDVRVLTSKNLFVEFEKEADLETVRRNLHSRHTTFDVIT